MPRKKTKSFKRPIAPDITYDSVLVSKMINKMMEDGKKRVAERMLYGALENVKEKTKKDPLEVFEAAIKNVSPLVQVRTRRIGGANYQIPVEVRGDRRTHYAMVWMIDSARSMKGRSFDLRLADEIMNAYNNQGDSIKKKEDTHRMAEANKAFAHFARY
jgi:small subunit ribosomal protein S7